MTRSFLQSMFTKIPAHEKNATYGIMSNARNAAICAVIVVPMFAPMMIAVA